MCSKVSAVYHTRCAALHISPLPPFSHSRLLAGLALPLLSAIAARCPPLFSLALPLLDAHAPIRSLTPCFPDARSTSSFFPLNLFVCVCVYVCVRVCFCPPHVPTRSFPTLQAASAPRFVLPDRRLFLSTRARTHHTRSLPPPALLPPCPLAARSQRRPASPIAAHTRTFKPRPPWRSRRAP